MFHELPYMLIAVDIDQTLAEIIKTHLIYYNKALELGLTTAEIEIAARTYKQTFDVPAIQAYREQNEQRFQEVRTWIRTSHEVHTSLTPIADSQAGTAFLSTLARNVGYYTVRPTEVTQATYEWLSTHGYPSPKNLVISKNHEDKLTQVLSTVQGRNERVMLIDDSLEPLLAAAARLCLTSPELIPLFSQLTIVGYNHTDESARGSQESNPNHKVGIVDYLTNWSAIAVQALTKRLSLL